LGEALGDPLPRIPLRTQIIVLCAQHRAYLRQVRDLALQEGDLVLCRLMFVVGLLLRAAGLGGF
jgi:hypothetical protein